ncbi:MAG: P-loop NTPase [Anaerolineae bacterium]|jgi:MinD superfamily P-loop ATPase|nr:P-loop NTPase [Anaerolineae bacterium]MBT7073634.1 P-loop NTPase [Anaerolineae bacterium]MBT7782326.1 P-loop NTPase [Anaerolineae bacterium]
MEIVVASGKGGTGKTTVATSLAMVASEQNTIRFLDCDVEAPNARLFLDPELDTVKEVGILIPNVDDDTCTYCGKCAEVCQFHAIAVIGKKTLVFPELCHGCGSCTLVCPENAITEELDVMGVLESGNAIKNIDFAQGVMNIGEPMAVPIIRELKRWAPAKASAIEIRDSPPGASCPVVETIRGADFALLVTEPTPFGLHDLKQVVEITKEFEMPTGVVINRDGIGNNAVEAYCEEVGIPIMMRIPMERRIAEAIASGKPLLKAAPEYQKDFENMLGNIITEVGA